ncbi:MAG TPA: glycosyltransferase family 9 protein [Smithella sp.]|nr:glycosyltransferase family 9 protein [Smithella sp.]
MKSNYRCLRHSIRVRLNYMLNLYNLKNLRNEIKKKDSSKKIIVVMLLEHLGDIVACEPIVRYIKKKNPNAYVIWGVKKAYLELVENNPNVDKTLMIHCLTERLLLENSGLFDEVVDLHFQDRYCSLCRRPFKKDNNFSKINLSNYFYHGSLLSAMAQSAGLAALDDQPAVYIPESAVRKVDNIQLPKEFIAINCTSNSSEKGWPADKWLQLLTEMKSSIGLPVYEIGTESFFDKSLSISQSLCGKLSILESAEVIKRANLFIGIDSGPAHLANAVQTPGVILLGSFMGFENYQPFSGFYQNSPKVEIIQTKGPVANIPGETVFSAVRRLLV